MLLTKHYLSKCQQLKRRSKAGYAAGKEINSRVGGMVNGKFEKDLSPEAQANWYKADYSKAIKL